MNFNSSQDSPGPLLMALGWGLAIMAGKVLSGSSFMGIVWKQPIPDSPPRHFMNKLRRTK